MSGEQEREELVAQLTVVHRAAVCEPCADEQREDVLPLGEPRIAAALGYLGEHELVDLGHQRAQSLERISAPQPRGDQHAQLQPARSRLSDEARQQRAQAGGALGASNSEHRPQNHLERERLHVGVKRERLLRRPARDLPLGDLTHDRLVRAHALAVELRKHQPPAREVVRPFQQQYRIRTQHRHERERAPGREPVPVLGVERADRIGVRQHDHRALEADEAHAEDVAVASATEAL